MEDGFFPMLKDLFWERLDADAGPEDWLRFFLAPRVDAPNRLVGGSVARSFVDSWARMQRSVTSRGDEIAGGPLQEPAARAGVGIDKQWQKAFTAQMESSWHRRLAERINRLPRRDPRIRRLTLRLARLLPRGP